MTRKRTKRSRSASRRRACFHKNNDQTRTSKQNPEQGQQTSNDQKQPSQQAPRQDQQTSDDQKQQLQWTLEQTQLRYNELQDKHDKLMDSAERLLGLCSISSFTTFLTKSIWNGFTGGTRLALQVFIVLTVVVVFVVIVLINGLFITFSYRDWDPDLPDIAQLEQKQSKEEKTTSLAESLNVQIGVLRRSNIRVSFALYVMYLLYAGSLELLVLAIIHPNLPAILSYLFSFL